MLLETEDLLLRKAEFEDWKAMYQNLWSRPESARYMLWNVTTNEEDARSRMQRTIRFQESHDTWLVCEKKTGQTIGFAGIEEEEPHRYWDAGIALGPAFVGKGYGKQILRLLLDYCGSVGGTDFYYSTRTKNEASKALARSCGFAYQSAEAKTDARTGEQYELEIYHKKIERNSEE